MNRVLRLVDPERESAWVVELNASDPDKPIYWGLRNCWTNQLEEAARFAREIDAHAVGCYLAKFGGCRVSKHEFQPEPVREE